MFDRGQKAGTVRFSIKPGGDVQRVDVAGDFSQWKPLPMRKQRDGSYQTTVPECGDSCQYKFLIDGRWVTDPDNRIWAINPYGTLNSVADLSPSCAQGGTASLKR